MNPKYLGLIMNQFRLLLYFIHCYPVHFIYYPYTPDPIFIILYNEIIQYLIRNEAIN